jgi:hypothetical protein
VMDIPGTLVLASYRKALVLRPYGQNFYEHTTTFTAFLE